jgi:hypothetical protein
VNAKILQFPHDKLERRALQILRDRKLGRINHSLTPAELEQAIEAIKQSDPDHPILQYLDRSNAVKDLDAS